MVDTIFSLRDFVLKLINKYENSYAGTLDEYLRSLRSSITQHGHERPSLDLFGQILEEGFRVPPDPFNPDWLKVTDPLIFPVEYYPIPAEEIPAETPKPPVGLSDFQYLERTVHFLIAELHRFSEKKPEDYGRYAQYARDYKYFGLKSATGHYWYNWDPFTFLECATRGTVDLFEARQERGLNLPGTTWVLLASLLDDGRTYE